MFHYSLKTLMLVVLGTSVFCALFFAFPMFLTGILFTLVLFLSAPALVAGCVYLQDGAQAFCLGCAVPTGLVMFNSTFGGSMAQLLTDPVSGWLNNNDTFLTKLLYLAYLVVVGLSGLTSLGVYRLAKRQSKTLALKSTPSPELTAFRSESSPLAKPFGSSGGDGPPFGDESAKNFVPAPPRKPNNP